MTHSVQGWDPPRRIAPQSLHLPGPSDGFPDKGRLAGLPALPAHAPLSHHSHLPFQDSCWSTEPKPLDLHPACLLQGLHHPDTHAQFLVIVGGVPLCVLLVSGAVPPEGLCLAWPPTAPWVMVETHSYTSHLCGPHLPVCVPLLPACP